MSRHPLRVIHVTPAPGRSGVGDYAADFARILGPHLDEYVPLHHGPPGTESVREMARFRRRLHRLVRDGAPGRTVVHAELSGGSAAALWALAGLRGVHRTATVHDAPRPVWMPVLTRGVARVRYLSPVLHRLLAPLFLLLERRVLREVDVVVLTDVGAEATRSLGIGRTVTRSHLVLPERAAVPEASERPVAVGLFGHVYRGKGFETIPRLRAALDDRVLLRVAGRGTEELAPMEGVEILGAVEGDAETEFFASVRLLLLPYQRRSLAGRRPLPASAAQLSGVAHRTPALALASATMDELAAEGGCLSLAGEVEDLAREASRIALDDTLLRAESARSDAYRARLDDGRVVAAYLSLWS